MTPGAGSADGGTDRRASREVVSICQNLLRMDTSNFGDDSGPGERQAAEYCAGLLADMGLDVELFEARPGRTSLVTRLSGADPTRPALVLHGHTDVVPAQAVDWQVDPFCGDLLDGMLWGRGAVDMKGMDAMILATIRDYVRTGRKPARDIIVALFADEEAGGVAGAGWAVDHRPDLFAGASEAISEVGGFSIDVGGHRAYLLQTAEKGLAWLRLVADGTAGHGSAINPDNAVTALAEAVARVGRYAWPTSVTPTVAALLRGVARLTGLPYDDGPDTAAHPDQIAALLTALGPSAKFIAASTQHTVSPTGLTSGYKVNVIPGHAEATLDMRFLPGRRDQAFDTLSALVGPDVRIDITHEDVGLEAPLTSPIVDAMADALTAEDPDATVLPYMLSGGTDNKSLSRLGITGYGFAPLRLPADLDFTGLFHGINERVPADALVFGQRVLDRLLATC
ncbi:MAG: M20/M25/M40 family metallo-hydrolase [Cellulomonadaceae bacterium]|jgi:acetylornithine deacetylase/succinyl-diaminopimelate desuccinylase-like protein|nr:M20/M25/M40 family metallo-hydrolase [Cellulomonadaceae bacterium]